MLIVSLYPQCLTTNNKGIAMQSQSQIRQSIVDKIVQSLKAGHIPWRKPWSGIAGPRIPTNFVTRRKYSGINIPVLWNASQDRGYAIDYYATFKQWQSVGATVKKGAKAIQVVFYRPIEKTVRDEDGSERVESFPLLRTIPIFSIHDVRGPVIEDILQPSLHPIELDHERREAFLHLVRRTKADVRHGGSQAFYSPKEDYIQVPEEERFENFASYASTLAHELAHWSESRLGWNGSYSEGELRAELSASFTTAEAGIPMPDLTNHAAYIGSWLTALENDPGHLFRATTSASKATDYLLSFSHDASVDSAIESTCLAC
jgi:antirestriction protein ArdC